MHRVLLVDEILRGVFEHIENDVDVDRKSVRATFVRLARVCQAWKDPALDFLWKFLFSTDALFSLIPGAIVDDNAPFYNVEVSPETLAKFFSYASRIRGISHHSRKFAKLSPSVLALLKSHHPEQIILPSLNSVHLVLKDAARRNIPATLYLSEHLRSVSIDVSFISRRANDAATHPGESLCAYLDAVARVATELHHLRLRGRIRERMADTVATMSNLRTLSMCIGSDLTPRTLAAISSFPQLEDLRVQLDGMDVDVLAEALIPSSTPPHSLFFPSLQTLHVRSSPAVIEALFDRLPPTNSLHTIRLESDYRPRSVDDWTPALALLAEKTYQTLTSLSIESLTSFCEVFDHAFPPKLHFSLDTLRPLSRLVHLTHFSIDPSVPADLSDADVSTIAQWYPSITSLGLWTRPVDAFDYPSYFTLQPRATPASLSVLAAHCTHLH
ncbi:hypothetical protein EW146_g5417, partial [Bondarzewia mesenterica]